MSLNANAPKIKFEKLDFGFSKEPLGSRLGLGAGVSSGRKSPNSHGGGSVHREMKPHKAEQDAKSKASSVSSAMADLQNDENLIAMAQYDIFDKEHSGEKLQNLEDEVEALRMKIIKRDYQTNLEKKPHDRNHLLA